MALPRTFQVQPAETVIAKLPAVDMLVNNVGIFEPKPFAEIPDADWYRFFEINVMSGVRLPALSRRDAETELGVQIPAEMVHYGITKTAQIAVAQDRRVSRWNRRDSEQHSCRADGVGRCGGIC
jgi:NAD(P)-dependent dehydrogenase (short-subunit alcohol dehydrogenase family)